MSLFSRRELLAVCGQMIWSSALARNLPDIPLRGSARQDPRPPDDAPRKSGVEERLLALATRNIAKEIGLPPSRSALVVCSREKAAIAAAVQTALEERGIDVHSLVLGARLGPSQIHAQALIKNVAGDWGLILLFHPRHAKLLFETAGRPDQGVRLPAEHFFTDWLIRPASLVRTYGVDMDEVLSFRSTLLSRLSQAEQIRVRTRAGTDVILAPRQWNATKGEVYTAPLEAKSTGRILVDGCAYGGPPAKPFELTVKNGRVVNLGDLLDSDRQQRMLRRDLTRDGNASVLAEFGIGINPGAKVDADVMESEQARGTCHFGFGNNAGFGGQNRSEVHVDLVILHPTIEVNGKTLCEAGKYLFKGT